MLVAKLAVKRGQLAEVSSEGPLGFWNASEAQSCAKIGDIWKQLWNDRYLNGGTGRFWCPGYPRPSLFATRAPAGNSRYLRRATDRQTDS